MKSLQKIEVSRKTVEDMINGEMTRLLHVLSAIPRDARVNFTLPGGDTFLLPITVGEEFEEERLVCTVL